VSALLDRKCLMESEDEMSEEDYSKFLKDEEEVNNEIDSEFHPNPLVVPVKPS